MGKATLRDWAQLAEIAASVGVIVSLVFVALSIERNSSIANAQVSDSAYDSLRSARELLIQDRTLLALTLKSQEELASLDELDKAHYQEWVILNLDEWERLHSRNRAGLIREENLEAWDEYFRRWFARYVTPEIWSNIRWRSTTEGFRDLLDAEMQMRVQASDLESS